jgi:hypothetical protein
MKVDELPQNIDYADHISDHSCNRVERFSLKLIMAISPKYGRADVSTPS